MENKVLITSKVFVEVDKGKVILESEGLEMLYPEDGPRGLREDELAKWGGEITAIIAGVDPYTGAIMDRMPNLKIISRVGVGCDSIDSAAAAARGIVVGITPGANHEAVADHTFGLMLAVAKKIPQEDARIKQGGWRVTSDLGWELSKKTLGIVGLGRVGRAVARRAQGFGMSIIGYDPYVTAADIPDAGIKVVTFQELVANCDVLSLHLPLMEGTHHLIGAEELAAMKPSAVLINTARGGVVDQDALYNALVNHEIAGAGLDVFDPEPPGNHPIVRLPNVVATSHTAGLTRESVQEMSRLAALNAVRILKGEPALHAWTDPQ